MRNIEVLQTYDYQDNSGVSVWESSEQIPFLDPQKAEELVDSFQDTPHVKFCLDGTCLRTGKIDGEVVLFPSESSYVSNVETIIQETQAENLPNKSQEEAKRNGIERFTDVIRDPEQQDLLRKTILELTYDYDRAQDVPLGERIAKLYEISGKFDRLTCLSEKNGSITEDEKNEYTKLLIDCYNITKKAEALARQIKTES